MPAERFDGSPEVSAWQRGDAIRGAIWEASIVRCFCISGDESSVPDTAGRESLLMVMAFAELQRKSILPYGRKS